jgi:hypothetical protein
MRPGKPRGIPTRRFHPRLNCFMGLAPANSVCLGRLDVLYFWLQVTAMLVTIENPAIAISPKV